MMHWISPVDLEAIRTASGWAGGGLVGWAVGKLFLRFVLKRH
jgi:hypothetical protein